MLDFELAAMYGVETAQLKRAVRRNIERFEGEDFMIELTPEEMNEVRSKCQFGTLNTKRGENFKYAPFAFTELGVAMLSSVLHSPTAIDINRNIMRAFVELRRLTQMAAANYQELQREINDVKEYIEDILKDQNDINEAHSAQLEAISMALSELQTQKRQEKPRRRIGFNAGEDEWI
ncbi:MAG: ORF6N domain-containing protein [Paludibacteraceae bacterium]|nr:ORF6N domain-containing protein [Paludibacteraceae bacterium]